MTFLESVGFREPGLRLAAPVSVEREGRRITVQQLVATPAGTDLVYDFSEDVGCCVPWGSDLERFEQVTIRAGEMTVGFDHGPMNTSVRPGRIERSLVLRPIPQVLRRVDVLLKSDALGEWSIPVELVPYPTDTDSVSAEIDASDTRHGVTITARTIVADTERTLIRLESSAEGHLWVRGLGGLSHGMRDGSTVFTMRDQTGRAYRERNRPDARDQFLDRSGGADIAEFGPLADDALELELEVPFVCAVDREARIEFDTPVTTPFDVAFSDIPVRVLGTDRPDASDRRHGGAAIGVTFDWGGWHGDRRVVMPEMPRVDGQMVGLGFGRGILATEPTTLDYVTVATQKPDAPHSVSFQGAVLQLRGPWRIRFTRPRP